MPELKVITFDLDNTLWDVDRVIVNAEQRMRTWLREHVPAFHERFPPETIFELRTEIVNEQPQLKHDLSRLREEVLYRAISRCGYPDALASEYAHQAFQLFFEARHEVEFFEGALESLAILAKHYVLGALTNGNADFTKLKLDGFFSFGYSAASVGAGKPAPDMFHAALEHTGARPEQVVHVGDHPVDDVQGASQLGMHTIWVNLGGEALPPGTPEPSDEVARVHDIPTAVSRIADRIR